MRDINDLHPEAKKKALQLVSECAKQGIKIKIGECLRTKAEQDALYAKRPKVTNASGSSYSSMHQWGVAFDFYLDMDIDKDGKKSDDAFNNRKGTFNKVGKIGESIGLEWGGGWHSITDLPHFQLPQWGSTATKLRSKYGKPSNFFKTWPKGSNAASTSNSTDSSATPHKYLIKQLQIALNKEFNAKLDVDGIQGDDTLSKCPTLTTKVNGQYPLTVKALKALLNEKGISCFDNSGVFGEGLELGLKKYKKKKFNAKDPVGYVEAGGKCWRALISY